MENRAELKRMYRRELLQGMLTAATAVLLPRQASARTRSEPVCGYNMPVMAIDGPAAWDAAYETRWGRLGPQTRRQIDLVLHNKNGYYDDSNGVFAWIVHYWIRAWVAMAELTGDRKYMDCCVSFIDYMVDHTDQRRILRGEIHENYVRDPLYFRTTGRGGPFWKRGRDAIVLNTGRICHGILCFVDTVYAGRRRWEAYKAKADSYFAQARIAVDAFDNDWQVFADKGSYHYRDSAGSGQLGVTRTAFNQSATMMSAHLILHKWRPDSARADKIRRLAKYWIDDFARPAGNGTVSWRYIIHPHIVDTEDVGHAGIDIDFLVAAYESGLTELTRNHMEQLARTYRLNVIDGRGGLNRYVDGTTTAGFDEHWNAAVGWFQLARYDPAIVSDALTVYNIKYRPESKPGILWARPMLGWANLLLAAKICS